VVAQVARAQAFGIDSALVAAALPKNRRWMCGGTSSGLWHTQCAGGSSAAFGLEQVLCYPELGTLFSASPS